MCSEHCALTPTIPLKKTPANLQSNPLSERKTEILQLLAKGMSFSEIGEILTISPHTVTAHIKKIYRKLQVHSRGEAVYEAAQMGLILSFMTTPLLFRFLGLSTLVIAFCLMTVMAHRTKVHAQLTR